MRTIKTLIRILFFIVTLVTILNVSSAEVATIKELQDNIRILEEKKWEITKQFSSDLWDIWEIKWFLKENLSIKETDEIKTIISDYNKSKEDINLEETDKEEIKKQLLELKRETYKKLVPYIEQTKLEEYLEYIRKNVDILKKWKELNEEIYKNRELLEQKVILLKEKIKTNEDKLKNEIDELINKKIDEKINIIKNNEKFKLLDIEKRKEIINITIDKIKIKLDSFDDTEENKKKIEIYNLLIAKLQEVLNTLK